MSEPVIAHLSDEQLESLLSANPEADADAEHVASCRRCQSALQDAKRLYNETQSLLTQDDGTADLTSPALIEKMVQQAMLHAPPPLSQRAWWVNMTLATFVTTLGALALFILKMPRWLETLRHLEALRAVPNVLFRSVASGVPGGWATIGLAGCLLLVLMGLPLLKPLRKQGAGWTTTIGILLALALPFALGTGSVDAQDSETPATRSAQIVGSFDDLPRITVSLRNVAQLDALAEICKEAGLSYVSRSQALSQKGTIGLLELRDTPVDEALMAVVGEASVYIERRGKLVTVRDAVASESTLQNADTTSKPSHEVADKKPADGSKKSASQINERPKKEVGDILVFGKNRTLAKDEVADSFSLFGGNATLDGLVREDVSIMGGNARVNGVVEGDLVIAGGNATIAGRVEGDVASMGGNVSIAEGGKVLGEVGAIGGNIHGRSANKADEREEADVANSPPEHSSSHADDADDVANSHGKAHVEEEDADEEAEAHWFGDLLHTFVNHVLLFLIGLFMMGVAGTRFAEMKRTLAATPLHSLGFGVLAFFGACILTVVLCITLIGIPIALCLVVAGFAAFFVGLAAVASVIGHVLPTPQLKNRPILQLVLGTCVLFVLSIVPLGMVLLIGLATAGFGAAVLTRFGGQPYPRL